MVTSGHPRVTDRRALTPSDRDDSPISRPPIDLPLLGVFPPELWLEIIGHVEDIATLSVLTRLNPVFHDMAERDLYHTITLDHDSIILCFCTCVSRSPHHAALVTHLHLPAIGEQILRDNQRLFLSTLGSLHNLEHLTLHLLDERLGSSRAFAATFSKGAVGLRFPLLRGFSTNLFVYILPLGLAFLQAHPLLADLDIAVSSVALARDGDDRPTHVQLGALGALACGPWFLHQGRFAIPPTLTHYHARDLDLEPGELPHIARLLGPQLVGLRVSERFAYHREQRGGGHAVALDELLCLFPRLRFLQLDMHFVPVPYISTHVVDCTAERPQSALGGVEDRNPRLTLAWICARRPWSAQVDMEAAPLVWDEFLRATAPRILHDWGDYVERIVYRHTAAPWTSVSLRAGAGGDGMELVFREDRGMHREQWKLV